jgi:hypothetical protein
LPRIPEISFGGYGDWITPISQARDESREINWIEPKP